MENQNKVGKNDSETDKEEWVMKNLILMVALVVAVVLWFGSLALANEPTSAQMSEFQEFINEGRINKEKLEVFLQQIRADFVPEGWEVVEDVSPANFKIKDVEFVSFHEKDETSVHGDVMRKRAKAIKANFGLADGKRLMENQGEIPAEVRDNVLVLSGAVLRDPIGVRWVPYLTFGEGGWHLYLGKLDSSVHNWGSVCKLSRIKSKIKSK